MGCMRHEWGNVEGLEDYEDVNSATLRGVGALDDDVDDTCSMCCYANASLPTLLSAV
jgi:hypothetical protein